MNYYVYAYLRHKNSKTGKAGTPYYIGKGKGKRAYQKHGKLPVPQDHTFITILESNLTELGALALERRYIRWFGRKDTNNGILVNLTDGGEGFSGLIFTSKHRKNISISKIGKTISQETKDKIRNGNRGKIVTEETRKKMSESTKGENHPMYGKQLPEETKRKLSIASSGENCSAETRIRKSEAQKGKVYVLVTCPYCNKIGGKNLMVRWHFDKCKHKT